MPSHRTILLLSKMSKIFEKILLKRMERKEMHNNRSLVSKGVAVNVQFDEL